MASVSSLRNLTVPTALSSLSPDEWGSLRTVAVQTAHALGAGCRAEDAAQDALARLFDAYRQGRPIENPQYYLRKIVRNIFYSYARRSNVEKMAKILPEQALIDPLDLELEYHRSTTGLQGCAQEIWSCFEALAGKIDGVIEFLFSKIIMANAGVAVLRDTESDTKVCSIKTKQLYVAHQKNEIDRRVRQRLRLLAAELNRRGLTAEDLFAVLKTPTAIKSCPGLTLSMAAAASKVIQQVQDTSKRCRFDILMRAGIDRQDLYVAKMPWFVNDLDALYAAARMPRAYTLLGMTACLEQILEITTSYRNLCDPSYIESLALDIIFNRPRVHAMDRWLAIVLLGVLYEQEPIDSSYIEGILTSVEGNIGSHPILRIGMAFAWIDSGRQNKSLLVREKVFPLLDPIHWHSGLSQLPITVIGSYMGSTAEELSRALAVPETWLSIVYGLQSKSYMANLGALAQLTHMPYHEPPGAIRTEIDIALHTHSASTFPLLRKRTALVPKQYWCERMDLK